MEHIIHNTFSVLKFGILARTLVCVYCTRTIDEDSKDSEKTYQHATRELRLHFVPLESASDRFRLAEGRRVALKNRDCKDSTLETYMVRRTSP
jgi:hypothetical protein